MLSIPKYPEQYAQHFRAIFYLLCCASQHHVLLAMFFCVCIFVVSVFAMSDGGVDSSLSPLGLMC